jgi:hypothetical protein
MKPEISKAIARAIILGFVATLLWIRFGWDVSVSVILLAGIMRQEKINL